MSIVLAIDTSHRPGNAAVLSGLETGRLKHCEAHFPTSQTTTESFALQIEALLAEANCAAGQVSLVVIGSGPGSFTGLRIGTTFAKVFCYATGAKLIGISTMDLLASQLIEATSDPPLRFWTLVDAHRGQLFAACYARQASFAEEPNKDLADEFHQYGIGAKPAAKPVLIEADSLGGHLRAGDWVVGPIAARLNLPEGVSLAPDAVCQPSARALGQLGHALWQQGHSVNPFQLVPKYCRKSAAEEKLA